MTKYFTSYLVDFTFKMNPSSYFRMPPPLSNEPPTKISTADIGKIVGGKDPSTPEEHREEEESPQPFFSKQQDDDDGGDGGGVPPPFFIKQEEGNGFGAPQPPE